MLSCRPSAQTGVGADGLAFHLGGGNMENYNHGPKEVSDELSYALSYMYQRKEDQREYQKEYQKEYQFHAFLKPSTSFRRTLINQSKRALFFTSVPFYWLIFFTYLLKWFDLNLFVLVNVGTMAMSYFGIGWGLLNGLAGGVR